MELPARDLGDVPQRAFVQARGGTRSSACVFRKTVRPYMRIAVPIEPFAGEVIGVLIFEVNLKYIWESSRRSSGPNRVLYRFPWEISSPSRCQPGLEAEPQNLGQAGGAPIGSIRRSAEPGRRRFSQPMRLFPTSGGRCSSNGQPR
jgi:hypothetical protein